VVTSDGQGNFQFPGLIEGRYSLATDKAGYFPGTFADILVGGASTGNGIVPLGDLNITAQRTLSGTVKWDDGEPVTNAIVHVMGFIGGAFSRAAFAQTAQTNDRGEFMLQGLRARRYVVFAYLRPPVVAPGTAVRVALPVFYPNAGRPNEAQVFDLRTNKDISAVALVMKEEQGVSIEGTITSEALPAGAAVQLGLVIPGVAAPYLVSTQTRVGEAFRLYPVPPGSYLLFAKGNVQPSPLVQIPGTAPGAPTSPVLAAALEAQLNAGLSPSVTAVAVTVNRGNSVRDLKITMPAPTIIEGKVEVEEAQPGQPTRIVPTTNVGMYLDWVPKMEVQDGILNVRGNAQGEFRITGAVKGQEYLVGTGSNFSGSYIASFTQGQKDLISGALPILAGGDPFRILLKRDGGRIEGKVKDGDKTPWRAFVVAAPRDRRIGLWFRITNTRTDGSFQLLNVAPGEYDVFALDRNDDDSFFNPEFLRRFAAGSKAVRVQASSAQTVDLPLTNTN
jgi:hypothetical protein